MTTNRYSLWSQRVNIINKTKDLASKQLDNIVTIYASEIQSLLLNISQDQNNGIDNEMKKICAQN